VKTIANVRGVFMRGVFMRATTKGMGFIDLAADAK